MAATASQATPQQVRALLHAWKGTDEDKILAYYSGDVVIDIPNGTLKAKSAVRDTLVRPFIAGFPDNVHAIRDLAFATNLVAV